MSKILTIVKRVFSIVSFVILAAYAVNTYYTLNTMEPPVPFLDPATRITELREAVTVSEKNGSMDIQIDQKKMDKSSPISAINQLNDLFKEYPYLLLLMVSAGIWATWPLIKTANDNHHYT